MEKQKNNTETINSNNFEIEEDLRMSSYMENDKEFELLSNDKENFRFSNENEETSSKNVNEFETEVEDYEMRPNLR